MSQKPIYLVDNQILTGCLTTRNREGTEEDREIEPEHVRSLLKAFAEKGEILTNRGYAKQFTGHLKIPEIQREIDETKGGRNLLEKLQEIAGEREEFVLTPAQVEEYQTVTNRFFGTEKEKGLQDWVSGWYDGREDSQNDNETPPGWDLIQEAKAKGAILLTIDPHLDRLNELAGNPAQVLCLSDDQLRELPPASAKDLAKALEPKAPSAEEILRTYGKGTLKPAAPKAPEPELEP